MKNNSVKRITKKDCNQYHAEMLDRGIYVCPQCKQTLELKVVPVVIKAQVIYQERKAEDAAVG